MDPNATLSDLRKYLSEGNMPHSDIEYAVRFGAVMAAFEALDEWLSKGGFLPDAWQR